MSQFSFDFSYEDDYDSSSIENALSSVFEDKYGFEILGVDFRSVDYSMYSEYADVNTSQCGVDFKWTQDYNDKAILRDVESALDSLRYPLIGCDFNSVN